VPRRKKSDGITPEKARAYLEAHARALRGENAKMKLLGGGVSSDIERMEYVAASIERFLRGEAPSLDRAFGIKQMGRRRGKPSKHLQWTIEVIPMIMREMSWGDICLELGKQSEDVIDDREIRRIVERHWDDAMEWYAARIHNVGLLTRPTTQSRRKVAGR
jgi:hypothetical protein